MFERGMQAASDSQSVSRLTTHSWQDIERGSRILELDLLPEASIKDTMRRDKPQEMLNDDIDELVREAETLRREDEEQKAKVKKMREKKAKLRERERSVEATSCLEGRTEQTRVWKRKDG